MPNSAPRSGTRTLGIYSEDAGLRAQFAARLADTGRAAMVEDEPTSFLLASATASKHDLIVLDVGDGAMLEDSRFQAARDKLAGIPLIVVSEALTPERVRQVVRLQAADWLRKPLLDQDISAVLSQMEGSASSSRVTTIIGASGGAGATTLALMAGHYLSQSGTVALVDLDFQTGSCGAYLNSQNEFDLAAVVANPDRLDAELLDLIKAGQRANLELYSFERPDLVFAPTARRFALRLLDLLTLRHKEVVIDLPNLSTPWFDDVVRHSDDVVIVFETNVAALRQAKMLLRRVEAARGGSKGIALLANKTRFRMFGNPISRKDVEKLLGVDHFHTAVRDHELLTDAVNRAIFPSEVSSHASFVRQAHRFLMSVFGGRSVL